MDCCFSSQWDEFLSDVSQELREEHGDDVGVIATQLDNEDEDWANLRQRIFGSQGRIEGWQAVYDEPEYQALLWAQTEGEDPDDWGVAFEAVYPRDKGSKFAVAEGGRFVLGAVRDRFTVGDDRVFRLDIDQRKSGSFYQRMRQAGLRPKVYELAFSDSRDYGITAAATP